MPPSPDDLLAALERLINGTATEADLVALRRAVLVVGEGNTLQIGKYNVRIGEGQNIQIGDHFYSIYLLPQPPAETIASLAGVPLEEGPVADYRAFLRRAYADLPLEGIAVFLLAALGGLLGWGRAVEKKVGQPPGRARRPARLGVENVEKVGQFLGGCHK